MFELLVLAAVVLGLVAVANYRFAVPPVDPGPPLPDYALQSAIACVGIAIAAAVSLSGTALIVRQAPVATARAFGLAAGVLAIGALAVVLAFVLSA